MPAAEGGSDDEAEEGAAAPEKSGPTFFELAAEEATNLTFQDYGVLDDGPVAGESDDEDSFPSVTDRLRRRNGKGKN